MRKMDQQEPCQGINTPDLDGMTISHYSIFSLSAAGCMPPALTDARALLQRSTISTSSLWEVVVETQRCSHHKYLWRGAESVTVLHSREQPCNLNATLNSG